MTTNVKLWRVYCNDEAAFFEVWSPTEPTTCPNNNTHTIDPTKTAEIGRVSETEMTVKEELVPTQGIHKTKGYEFNIPAGTPGDLTTFDLTWEHPITLLNGDLDVLTANIGDDVEGWVIPYTPVGAITAPVSVGDTVISVTNTVLQNVYIGFNVVLREVLVTTDLGICKDKDYANGTITVSTPSVNAHNPATPTYVNMIVKVVESLHIRTQRVYEIAKKKLGGKNIDNSKAFFQVRYTNNDGAAKKLAFTFEYLY